MTSTTATTWRGLGQIRELAERWWDRVDRSILRLQGRLDTPGYDRWLPYGFAILQAVILIALVLARFDQLDHGVETAKYAQAVWQIGEDLKPITTLAGGNILVEQGSIILYPLSVITSVLPRIESMLVIKSLALASATIPLWRLARHDCAARRDNESWRSTDTRPDAQARRDEQNRPLGIGATSTIVFVYSIYPYVHNMNIADFTPAVLAVPALMWAVLFGFREQKRLMTVAVIVALCCRSDLGIAVAGLGILLLIERRRRVGLIALALGTSWFLLSIYGLQRGLSDNDFSFLAPYAEFGDTPLGVLWGIASNPIRFAQIVSTEANFQILVTLFAPVLFLPLTAPRYLMPAVPLYVLYMGADVPEGRLREAAQAVPITVFVFVATVFALKRTGRILVKRVRVERRIILALLLTATVFFIRDSSTTLYRTPWDWGGRDEADQAQVWAIEQIPEDEPVRATASSLPLLSERLGVYELDFDVGKFAGEDPSVPVVLAERLDEVLAAATQDVDWLIVDIGVDAAGVDSNTIGAFRSRLAGAGWEQQLDLSDAGIEVYRFTGIIAPVLVDQGETDLFGFEQIDAAGDGSTDATDDEDESDTTADDT